MISSLMTNKIVAEQQYRTVRLTIETNKKRISRAEHAACDMQHALYRSDAYESASDGTAAVSPQVRDIFYHAFSQTFSK